MPLCLEPTQRGEDSEEEQKSDPEPRSPLTPSTYLRLLRFLICRLSLGVYVKLIYRSQNIWLVAFTKTNADGFPHASYN